MNTEIDPVENLISTSAEDCRITIMNSVSRDPVRGLQLVATTLDTLNTRGLEKKSHRQSLLKAGRAALKRLGTGPSDALK